MTDTPTTAWQRRLRRAEAARYLREIHGVPFGEKPLANRNASGLEPEPEYLGTIPSYRQSGESRRLGGDGVHARKPGCGNATICRPPASPQPGRATDREES